MKKTSKRLLGRIISVVLAVLFQVLWVILLVLVLRNHFPLVGLLIELFSTIAILWIVSKDINPAYKLAWTILILALPIAGAVIYLLFGKSRLGKELQRRLDGAMHEASQYLVQDEAVSSKLEEESRTVACQTDYLYNTAGFPVYQNTKTQYFRVG